MFGDNIPRTRGQLIKCYAVRKVENSLEYNYSKKICFTAKITSDKERKMYAPLVGLQSFQFNQILLSTDLKVSLNTGDKIVFEKSGDERLVMSFSVLSSKLRLNDFENFSQEKINADSPKGIVLVWKQILLYLILEMIA